MPTNFSMYEKVFDLMGLLPVPGDVRERINAMGPQNSMAAVHKKTDVKSEVQELTPKEVEMIMQNEAYRQFAARFNLSLVPA